MNSHPELVDVDPLTLLADCGLDASGIATAIPTRFQLPLPETQ